MRSTTGSMRRSIAFILDHGEAKVLIADREFSAIVARRLGQLDAATRSSSTSTIPSHEGGELLGEMDYEAFLAEGDPAALWPPPADEWQAIALSYTSGTTGNPKGVVYHHRGAYLNALGNVIAFGLTAASVYLWTLPMFHCSGWTYTWAVTAVGGTHVCLRRVDPALIFPAIAEHRRDASLRRAHRAQHARACAGEREAPVRPRRSRWRPAARRRPRAVIAAMERMGFRVTHLYGLTETYGPATLCAWQEEWGELPLEENARPRWRAKACAT